MSEQRDRFANEDAFDADVTYAGTILQDGEGEIAEACSTLLLRLYDPDEKPDARWYRDYHNKEHIAALCKKAALAAMAVLLEDRAMDLPVGIEQAYGP